MTGINKELPRVARVLALLMKRAQNRYGKIDSYEYPHGQPVYREFCDLAGRHGFTVLGAGYFSVVFSHRLWPQYAFKFGMKKEDSGAAYAAWARANPMRHVPEILHAMRYKCGYCVVMPRYVKTGGSALPSGSQAMLVHGGSAHPEPGHDEFYEALRAIHHHFKGLATFDLHGENVMRDAAGDLIITDPVSNTADDV